MAFPRPFKLQYRMGGVHEIAKSAFPEKAGQKAPKWRPKSVENRGKSSPGGHSKFRRESVAAKWPLGDPRAPQMGTIIVKNRVYKVRRSGSGPHSAPQGPPEPPGDPKSDVSIDFYAFFIACSVYTCEFLRPETAPKSQKYEIENYIKAYKII